MSKFQETFSSAKERGLLDIVSAPCGDLLKATLINHFFDIPMPFASMKGPYGSVEAAFAGMKAKKERGKLIDSVDYESFYSDPSVVPSDDVILDILKKQDKNLTPKLVAMILNIPRKAVHNIARDSMWRKSYPDEWKKSKRDVLYNRDDVIAFIEKRKEKDQKNASTPSL